MDSKDAKTRAIENAREPVRKQVYDLISKEIENHTNVVEGKINVKFYFPEKYKWTIKTLSTRKTIDGEEKVLEEKIVECIELDWLVEELEGKGYGVKRSCCEGYVWGYYGFLEITA